jgi:hypothetical protein
MRTFSTHLMNRVTIDLACLVTPSMIVQATITGMLENPMTAPIKEMFRMTVDPGI